MNIRARSYKRSYLSFAEGDDDAVDPDDDEEEPDEPSDDEEDDVEDAESAFLSAFLASWLSAPDLADASVSRLRFAVP